MVLCSIWVPKALKRSWAACTDNLAMAWCQVYIWPPLLKQINMAVQCVVLWPCLAFARHWREAKSWPWTSEPTTSALAVPKQVQAGPGIPTVMEHREIAADQPARRMPVPPPAAAAGERRTSTARQHPSQVMR